MRYFKYIVGALFGTALLVPAFAMAASAVPWSIQNLTDTFISPNLVNGTAKGILVSASSTINSTLTVSSLTSGNCVQAGTGGLLTTAAAPCGSGGGSVGNWFTPNVGYNSTSTAIGFLNGLFSNSSTTINGVLRLSNFLSGALGTDATGLVYKIGTSTPTVGTGIAYSGTFGDFLGGSSGTLTATLGTNITPNELNNALSANSIPYSDSAGTLFKSVATSSITAGNGITFTGTPGALVGGTSLTITNSIGYPFTGASNSTSTATGFTGGLFTNGSTTISSVGSGLVGANNGLLYGFASSSLFGYTPLNPTRQLTVAGMAQQITSSAGAQDLSADRTWTLSLPNYVKIPSDFSATNGSTTNATSTNLSVTGSSTLATLFGAGLSSCNSASNALTWNAGTFGCNTISSGAGGAFPFAADSNFGVTVYSTSTPTLWFKNTGNSLFASGTIQAVYASTTAVSATNGLYINNWALATSTTVCKTGNACQFSTISAAIASGARDIYVKDGTYSEQVTFSNTKTNLHAESLNTIIQCNGSTQSPCVTLTDESTIQGFTLNEANAALVGVAIDASDHTLTLIRGNRVNNFATSTKYTDTANTTFYNRNEDNTYFNTKVCWQFDGTQANANWIYGNRCRPMAVDGAFGAYVVDGRGITFTNNDVEGTTTTKASVGYYFGATSRDDTVTGGWDEALGTGLLIAAGANNIGVTNMSITSHGTDINDQGTGTILTGVNRTGTKLTIFGAGLVSNGSTTIPSVGSGLVGANNGLLYGFSSTSLFGFTPASNATTLTIAGTANQLTSSAGAQDLSTNRTWTLSLPNHVIFPLEYQATNGSTTNATSTNLSVTGSSTLTTLFGAGLSSCNGASNALTWNAGLFGCNSISASGGAFPFTPTINFAVNTSATTTPLWAQGAVGGVYSFMASNTAAFDRIIVGSSTTSGLATSTFTGNVTISGNATTTGLVVSSLGGSGNRFPVVNGAGQFSSTVQLPLSYANGGTGTTTGVQGQLAYYGSSAYQAVATSSLSAGTGISFTGTPGALVGGTNLTINSSAGKQITSWNVAASGGDFTTIQGALDACGTAGGGWIMLLDASYAQAGTGLTFKGSNCHVVGRGVGTTTISFTGATTLFKTNSAAAKYANNSVSDLTITGDGTAGSIAIDMSDMSHGVYEHLKIDNVDTAYRLNDTQNITFYNILRDTTNTTLKSYGINASSTRPTNDNMFENSFFGCVTGQRCVAVNLNNAQANSFYNITAEPTGTNGSICVQIRSSSLATNNGTFSNIFYNQYCEGNQIGISASSTDNRGGNALVFGNNFYGGQIETNTTNVAAESADNVEYDLYGTGIQFAQTNNWLTGLFTSKNHGTILSISDQGFSDTALFIANNANFAHNSLDFAKIALLNAGDTSNLLNLSNLGSGATILATSSRGTDFVLKGSNGVAGFGTTTPWGRLTVDTSTLTTNAAFAVSSTSVTSFAVLNSGNIVIGTTTRSSIDPNNSAIVTIDAGTTNATEEGLDVFGNVNDFFETNVKNYNTGTAAQACSTATANNGTDLTGFISLCANNGNFWNPQTYNVGGPGDTSLMGLASGDLFITQGTSGRKTYFLNGGTSTSTNLSVTIDTNLNVGIGSSSPWAQLSVSSSTSIYSNPFFLISTSSSMNPIISASATSTGQKDWSRFSIGTSSMTGVAQYFPLTVQGAIYSTKRYVTCETMSQFGNPTSDVTRACAGTFDFDEDGQGAGDFGVDSDGTQFYRIWAGATASVSALVASGDGSAVVPTNGGSTGAFTSASSSPIFEARIAAQGTNATSTAFMAGFYQGSTGSNWDGVKATLSPGYYFMATSTNNWQAVAGETGSGADPLSFDTGVASSTGSYQTLRIILSNTRGGVTTANYYINNTLVGSLTTGPSGSAKSSMNPVISIGALANAGLAKSLKISYLRAWADLIPNQNN